MSAKWERAFEGVFLAALGAMLFELAATRSGGLFDLLLAALLGLSVWVSLDRWGLNPGRAVQALGGRVSGSRAPLVLLAIYMALDLAGAFRAALPGHVPAKYKVVALMLFLSYCTLLYVDSPKRARRVLLALAVSSGGTALLTLLGRLLRLFPMPYAMRLTLRRDYNVFATTLLLGWLCAAYCFAQGKRALSSCLWFGLSTGVTLAVLWLSSSRRVFLMLPFILAFWAVLLAVRGKREGNLGRTLLTLALSALLCAGTMAGAQAGLRAQQSRYGPDDPLVNGAAGEGGAAQRYETVSGGGLLQKRGVLWRIAWEDYRSFSGGEPLWGRGFAYDIALYDQSRDPQLEREYPHREPGLLSAHNFVLADLLNGGVLKALAGILLVLALAAECVRLARTRFTAAAFYGNALAIVIGNNLVSNRYGLLYDKFFYLFGLLLLMERRIHRKEGREAAG